MLTRKDPQTFVQPGLNPFSPAPLVAMGDMFGLSLLEFDRFDQGEPKSSSSNCGSSLTYSRLPNPVLVTP
ncbi:hypothetical protein TWF569_007341 [Orbilia oligospora]|uniref:Uncharacterized protein n=1 Tax=Orbilia oligospora TaxID=2813651 RepID=A0A7C8JET2_ORBOL|nr:hypothetical protein TWF102_010743 [Orbilia oligospora]KAF3143251.1 hypothetical protein TWF569_007341 [Orbilia oligospora]KAF3147944.1 hypothetical protein TWF594_001874 [Orbilia oligospora]KAF3195406.1 hypothetical protein TWF225_003792 [Orbilia oligospora]TGJ63188.1 hypothetical protein EYR41_011125 [Orbilia oligospora]